MGQSLARELLQRGHRVRGLVRPTSQHELPLGCETATGDALRASTFTASVRGCHTLVHLVGTPHPAPWKENQFRAVDLVSAKAAIEAALAAGVSHFVYVSVAQPAPVMRAYIRVRAECESLLRASGLPATILRPWYVLGPGRRWPVLLQPLYRIMERIPATRETAIRLGMVRQAEMLDALVWAVENPAPGMRIMETQQIRARHRVA